MNISSITYPKLGCIRPELVVGDKSPSSAELGTSTQLGFVGKSRLGWFSRDQGCITPSNQ